MSTNDAPTTSELLEGSKLTVANPAPTGAERRARDKNEIDLDRQVLDDNISAAIAASERLHLLARKKMQALGLDSGGVVGGNGAQPAQAPATALSDELVGALAQGTVKTVADAVNPLKARIAKLEGGARKTPRALTWICEDASATKDSGRSCEECGSCGPRMRPGPTLLTDKWLAIARRREEFLCGECVQQRCRERLGRELKSDDLSGCDANAAWLAALGK